LLASHKRVHTFPETGLFLKTFGMRGTVLPWVHLGLTAGKERRALEKLLASQAGAPGPLPNLPARRFSLSRSMADTVAFLDGLAQAHGKDVWVEKTPRHVFHARRIRRTIPGALCIHMVRDGRDVVASIVDRGKKYPDRFPRQSDPSYAVRQWNRAIGATAAAFDEPGHAAVFYESLVADVEGTMKSLCGNIGLQFEADMLVPADRAAFTAADEEWKAQVNGPVEAAASKFKTLFNGAQRDWITRRLDLDAFQRIKEEATAASGGVLVSASR